VSRGAPRFPWTVAAVLTALLCIAGCRRDASQSDAAANATKKPSITAEVCVDKTKVRIGDTIRYTIEVTAAPSIKVKMPPIAENLAGLAVKDFGAKPPATLEDGRVVYQQWYALDTYVSGVYIIPPATIHYVDAKGKPREIKTTDVFIEVASSLDKNGKETGDIRDIRNPLPIPAKGLSLAARIAIGAGAGALVLAALIVFVVLRRKRKAAKPPVPPEIKARAALQALLQKRLIEQGQVREFYYQLSAILRIYIEEQFGLRAPEQTTEEFLESLGSSDALADTHKTLLHEFLETSDIVKYARHIPTRSEVEDCFKAAHRLIDETTQAKATEEASAENAPADGEEASA